MPDHQPKRHIYLFVGAQFVAYCGTWMQKTALGWLVWELTHSTTWVAAIALSDVIALIWIAPLAGAVTDRNNPFILLVSTIAGLCLLSVLLWGMAAGDETNIWLVLFWAIAYATVHGFNHPVRILAINSLVSRDGLSRAIALNSIAMNTARILGPVVAASIILAVGISDVFIASAATYIVMCAVIVVLRRRLSRPGHAGKSEAIGMSILEGFRYALDTPHVFVLLVAASAFALLARPFSELFPAIAGQVLNGGPDTLAWLMSAQGIGAMFGALWMLRYNEPRTLPKLMRVGALGMGIALTGMAFAPADWMVMACIGLAGLFHVVTNIAMQSMAQLVSDDAMRGRIISLYAMIFRAGPAVGAIGIAMAANWLPLDWLISVGGFAFCLVMILLPRHLDDPKAGLVS